MQIRILGCSGAVVPGQETLSFLVNTNILLDAGAAASTLTLPEQYQLEHIFISHSHFDHIKDLPLLADNSVMVGANFCIYGTEFILKQIKEHLFNDVIWPDFTQLPSREKPTVKLIPIEPRRTLEVNGLSIKPFPVRHAVEAVGYVVTDDHSSIIFTGDTGYTEAVAEEANALKDLRAIFIETSFPDTEETLADASGHLTPHKLEKIITEVKNPNVMIYIFHIKPQHMKAIRLQLNGLHHPHLHILNCHEYFNF